ncbi:NADH-quinone oxidoreductase subunit L [Geomonas subterranea]|uniref:NADH-quinone oxidoreductase subunit L n=1 Tax=Geomonas subterranea TaxID=2847989 RepID=A0ABX8LCZ2_9BACT|nr:NADH-quinone oxidoreductase subunit L [Geomonas subterranea]QXE89887.1 NADH-quinone oxidoreductase subunit L [Geomonas subterranea]QXM07995.1 NADH-quinone oxidoreductase subunit L [Geomonas subterranea]
MLPTYLTLMLLFPLLGGLACAVAGRKLPRALVEVLACATVWGSFACAVLAAAAYTGPQVITLTDWFASFDLSVPFSLYLDPLSLSMTVMIGFVCGLIHVYSVFYMREDEDYARYFALLNLFVFAMLTLVLGETLPLLYLGWEGVGFCSYLLIGFWYSDSENADAGRKAFITTRIGDVALMIALAWLFQLFGTLSITKVNGMGFLMPGSVITMLGILFLIAAMGKSAQMPLMVWLPDAMAGPTPVSAMIHAATMVTAGVYLLARLLPLIGSSQAALAAIAVTGGVTAFYGATCALAQRDLKRVLAYSTISQIGYMMLGVGAGAVTAATFHLLVHAFFKALLFLGAGCVIAAMHHEQDIYKMGGLRRSLPLTFWSFLAGAACLAGIPLTGGFFSKDSILLAVWLKGGVLYQALYLLGLLTALITAYYSFRLVFLVFAGGNGQVHRSSGLTVMELVLVPLAILGLLGGLLDLPAYLGGGYLSAFFEGLPAGDLLKVSHEQEIAMQILAGAMALLGLLTAYFRYGKGRADRMREAQAQPSVLISFLSQGWYFDKLYHLVLIRPYQACADFLWERVDRGVIDASVDGLGSGIGGAGRLLGRWSTGKVAVYLISFAAGGALILGYLAWLAL